MSEVTAALEYARNKNAREFKAHKARIDHVLSVYEDIRSITTGVIEARKEVPSTVEETYTDLVSALFTLAVIMLESQNP
jgi:hypothetical protein